MIIALDPESVFPRTGPQRGEREMAIEDLRGARRGAGGAAASRRTTRSWRSTRSSPCRLRASCSPLLGVALGTSNRKDGKLAAFVLGIGVIFAYYVIMFMAQSLTKGFWIPAWLAMWIPDLVLGAAGVCLLVRRARSADQPIRIPLPAWLRRRRAARPTAVGDRPRRRSTRGRRAGAGDPHPALLAAAADAARRLCRAAVRAASSRMTTVGMLGLFYISSFIDKSDKLFKGQISLGMLLEFLFWSTPEFLTYIIAIAVLLSGLVTVGLLTKNSELIVMRACGISLYRTALPMVVFALAAGAVLVGIQENVLATANRRADQLNHHIRTGSPQTFGLLNRKWIVGRERRDLSLSVPTTRAGGS